MQIAFIRRLTFGESGKRPEEHPSHNEDDNWRAPHLSCRPAPQVRLPTPTPEAVALVTVMLGPPDQCYQMLRYATESACLDNFG
jgi:hypothetical protein